MKVATSPVAGAKKATPASRWRVRIDVTPLFRIYARRRYRQLRAQDPVAAQRTGLRKLLSKAKDTRFGRDHDFSRLAEAADYQRAVPLRRYDEMWQHYWKSEFPRLIDCTWPGVIPYFVLTSGTTTGITKYIPCSRQLLVAYRGATLDLVSHHLSNRPDSALFAGRNFMLGGSTGLKKLAPGVLGGDMSGIIGRTAPAWARPFYFPPRRLDAISDWEEKIATLAPASLTGDIRAFGGTPSWMLLFFEKLATLRPEAGRRLAAFYPDLELLVHGGVNFAPYRSIFAEWLKGSRAETREVYPASEGFIAVADRGDGEGLRMLLDSGLFYEFVPVEELDGADPTRHWLANAETGVDYALVLSTCAGLWSYLIGDTIRFVDLRPPRILITGRTSYALSAFGEHLIGEEIEKAVAAAAAAIATGVPDFAVGALFPQGAGEAGRHLYVVEFSDGMPGPDELAEFARVLDRTLCALNLDYRDHRAKDFQMRSPVVYPVPPGTFAAWMKRRGRFGGQNKVPRVINDQALFDDLKTFAGCT
jgi:GH3 auxin-responsive promoter